MSATLRAVARFGLLFTKTPPPGPNRVISDSVIKRVFGGYGDKRVADDHGILPLTYEWDMISDKGELAKGGWAGQLLYINRNKDVVVAWFGTNKSANPKVEPLPCRVIANTFF